MAALRPTILSMSVRPGAHWAEHVASQKPGADVLHLALRKSAVFVAMHVLPRTRREKPFEQLCSTDAEGVSRA
jgi:hypothetical protein